MDSDIQQGPSTTPLTAAVAPQIRSRITVVCAECKRLKLKCDRRNPCGSCQKRDTVSRCIYSPAAAEKVDLHSLNNRLIQVEATLAQLTSGQFTPSYPFSAPSTSSGAPPPPSLALNVTLSPPTIQHCSLAIPLEDIGGTWLNEIDLGFPLPTDFSTPSSIADSNHGGSCSAPNVKVEPRSVDIPFAVSNDYNDIEMTDRLGTASPSSSAGHPPPSTATSSPIISSSRSPSAPRIAAHTRLPPTSVYYISSQQLSSSPKARLTPELIALLPSLNGYSSSSNPQPTLLSYLTFAEESSAYTYPFLNWKTLRERALELVVNARPNAASPAANARDKEMAREREKEKEREKKEKEAAHARQLFSGRANGSSSKTRPVFGGMDVTMDAVSSHQPRSHYRSDLLEDQCPRLPNKRDEGIPFFAALCAAIALGVLEESKHSTAGNGRRGSSASKYNPNTDAAYWYALSVQAVGVWESDVCCTPVSADCSSPPAMGEHESEKERKRTKEEQQHEMDYIVACLLQLTYLAKDGPGVGGPGADADEGTASSPGLARDGSQRAKGVAAVMFPLVGKIVNYARQMSLNKDPDDLGPPVLQNSDNGYSTSPTAPGPSTNLPSSAKKARSNSKLSDPSVMAAQTPSKPREPRFTLFEAEIRRRVWWTIMYYDLFVSDVMNQPPLIADNTFNTKLPVANVDEKVFGPMSIRIPPTVGGGEDGTGYSKDGMRYFEIRSRLTILVRGIKKRMNTPEFGHAQQVRTSYYGTSANSHCYSIDQAASMETEVRAWLADLPPYYQLEDTEHEGEAPEPALIAQRCEVAMTAHRLVLRLYLPFLRKHAAGVPHQASLGTVNAAHGIMRAAKTLSDLWKSQASVSSALSPALFDFYPLPRCIFDAAVVCAHAVIKQPSTVWAATAMEDVDTALDIMKDVAKTKFGSAVGATYVVSSTDCARIIDALKSKAEGGGGSRRAARSTSPNVPSKRKHYEVDELHDSPPPTPAPAYVYPNIPPAPAPAPVPSSSPVISQPVLPPPVSQNPKRQPPFPSVNGADSGTAKPKNESSSPKGSDKDKKQKRAYPAVGFRKRTLTKDSSPLSPAGQTAATPMTPSQSAVSNPPSKAGSRRQSVSVVQPKPGVEHPTPVRTAYPPPQQPSHSPATPQAPPFSSSTTPQQLQAAQEQFAYRSRSSSLSQDPRLLAPRRGSMSVDYPMAHYATPEEQHAEMPSAQQQIGTNQELHLRPSLSRPSHSPQQQQPQQTYVDSPTSYEQPREQAMNQYEFSSYTQSPQSSINPFPSTTRNPVEMRTDEYASTSSPYGAASSSGQLSAASSPYNTNANTASATPTFGAQTHQPSPPTFGQKVGPTPQEYYGNPVLYDQGFDNSVNQQGLIHQDAEMVQSAINGVMDDPLIFDSVAYDVKPSMEELNEQHRQQQAYPAYPEMEPQQRIPHSHSQLTQAVPTSQVWTTLPQHGHPSDGAGQYWTDASVASENATYYHHA